MPWGGERRFSFELPTYVDIKGQRAQLPASFTSYLPGMPLECSASNRRNKILFTPFSRLL
jgi:hypothetical protein